MGTVSSLSEFENIPIGLLPLTKYCRNSFKKLKSGAIIAKLTKIVARIMKRTKIVARIMKRTKIVARISTGSRIYARIIKVRKNPKKVRKNPKSTQESVKKSRIYARIKNDFCSRTVWRGVANPPSPSLWRSQSGRKKEKKNHLTFKKSRFSSTDVDTWPIDGDWLGKRILMS